MAKGIYVGVNNVARKVKKIYVGAEKTGELKSGNIFPTSGWTETSVNYANTTDGYTLEASSSTGTSYSVKRACDNSYAGTYWQTNTGTSHWIRMYYPSATKITKMKVCLAGSSLNNIQVQGCKSGSGWAWKTLYTISPNSSGELDHYENDGGMVEITLSNTDYYNYYRLISSHSSSAKFTVREWWVSEYEEKYTTPKSVARKVKKAYIGVGGIARPFYSAEQKLVYYGTTTDLSKIRYGLAATTIGDYALFGGGSGSTYYGTIDAYNKNLIKSNPTGLSYSRAYLSATTIGDYAIFGGGYNGSDIAEVNTYNKNLAAGTTTALAKGKRYLAATSVGDYAIFAGGNSGGDEYAAGYSATVETYTSNLVKGTASNLSQVRRRLSATTIGDYALFGGGSYLWTSTGNTAWVNTVDTYTSNLVKGTATALSQVRSDLAATSVGDYALFGGGMTGASSCSKVVDTYTSNLVKGTASDLSQARYSLAATSVGDYALFGGGMSWASSKAFYSTVDTYDKNLVKSTTSDLSLGRSDLAAASIGDYAIFAGGARNGTYYGNVDVYQVI